jgi:hypothetical protein
MMPYSKPTMKSSQSSSFPCTTRAGVTINQNVLQFWMHCHLHSYIIKIEHTGKLVLEGACLSPGLWAINLPHHNNNNNNKASSAYSGHITTEAIKFLHVACFSPTTATWTQAIEKGFFQSILVLTANTVHRQLLTAMGHMESDMQKHAIHMSPKMAQQQRSERV